MPKRGVKSAVEGALYALSLARCFRGIVFIQIVPHMLGVCPDTVMGPGRTAGGKTDLPKELMAFG